MGFESIPRNMITSIHVILRERSERKNLRLIDKAEILRRYAPQDDIFNC